MEKGIFSNEKRKYQIKKDNYTENLLPKNNDSIFKYQSSFP